MNSTNPVWKESVFKPSSEVDTARMTINGTIQKTGILLIIAILTGAFSWNQVAAGSGVPYQWIGFGGGLLFAIVASFKPSSTPITAPLYAGFEGLFLGGISAYYSALYNGIATQAFSLTMLTLGIMLFLYHTRIIRVTDKLRSVIMVGVGAVGVLYLVSFIGGFFGMPLGFLHGNGVMSIGISLVIVGIAAFSLLLDFDFIERGEQSGAPKHMEWYGAFALMVTLVWLYIEFLRLLSKLNSRD